MAEEAFIGGRFADPTRDGDTVVRRAGAAVANVHALLDHLAGRGFALAPRAVSTGPDGREVLTHLPGAAGHPPLNAAVRSERALRSAGRAVRALHDAGDGFTAPEPGIWERHDAVMPTEIDCIGHGDLNPGNLLFDGDQVVGIIDFDVAGPTNRAFDLALLAHHLVPLQPTDDLAAFGWDHKPDRVRRLRTLAAAYGRGMSPAQLVDYAALRLLSMGAHMQQQIDVGNPAFAEHGQRDEPAGYRSAAAFVLAHRDRLLR
jgi:Ser/Thr protein kinase RdoA (MazF antagonist)